MDHSAIARLRNLRSGAPVSEDPFVLQQHDWGYVVRSERPPELNVAIIQGICGFLGLVCAFGAIGIWIVPASLVAQDLISMRLGIYAFLMSLSAMLLWFASRGYQIEFHVDTRACELREMVTGSNGKSFVVARYGFERIGGVFIQRGHKGKNCDKLVLRFGNSPQTMAVAVGSAEQLASLRDRLGQDLMRLAKTPERAPMRVPMSMVAGA